MNSSGRRSIAKPSPASLARSVPKASRPSLARSVPKHSPPEAVSSRQRPPPLANPWPKRPKARRASAGCEVK